MYSIIRISERKMKSLKEVKGYENHALRKMTVPNADPAIQNEVLIGSFDIVKDVEEYTKDCKTRKNSVLCRDILLTSSPEFFEGASDSDVRKWVYANLEFLRDKFGDMIRFAALHRDEHSLHITALLVPKVWSESQNCYTLNNRELFGGYDGPKKLVKLQDEYAEAMKGFGLSRGIHGSKATHLEVKKFYSLIKQTFNDRDYETIIAKARERDMMEKRVKELYETLKAVDEDRNEYRDFSEKLAAAYEKLEQDTRFYENVIERMAAKYNVSNKEFQSFVNHEMSNSRGREI